MTEEWFQTLDLGVATEDVIAQFQNMCYGYENIALALESLLSKRALRKGRYKFRPLDPKSATNWSIKVHESVIGDIQHTLGKLDDYVKIHRLKDRASGIEDLLCGPLDEDIQYTETSKETLFISDHENITPVDEEETAKNEGNSPDLIVLVEGAATLKCSFCQEQFFSKESLQTHTQEIHGIVSLHCLLCEEEFKTNYKLNVHYRKKHNKKTVLSCPLCSACHYTNQSLQEHCRQVHLKYLNIDKKGNMRISDGQLSKCSECNYYALRKGRLWSHLEKVHGITHEMHCDTCDSKFASYRLLQHHVMQVHTLVNSCCEICGKNCKNRAALNRHRAMHTQIFNCRICSKIFRDRRSRLQHEKRHDSSVKFSCPHCGRSFNQKANMTRHVKVTHLKEGKMSCEFCSFETFYQEALTDHVNRVHLGLKNSKFECQLCGKCFPKRVNFKEHMDKHEGRYNYSCAKCGKKYRNKARCKTHFLKCPHETSIFLENPSKSPTEIQNIQNAEHADMIIPLQTISHQDDLNLLLPTG